MSKYWPPYGSTDPNAAYQNGDLTLGIDGSIPPAQAIEQPQREIVNLLLAAGLTPDGTRTNQLVDIFGILTPKIVNNVVMWVRPDGNDANDGSANDAAHAFQTINAARDATRAIATTGSAFQIRLGGYSGSPVVFSSPTSFGRPGASYQIIGDVTNQSAYIIQGAGAPNLPVVAASACSLKLSGLTLSNTGTIVNTLLANSGATVTADHVTFTAAAGNPTSHCAAFNGGALTLLDGIIFSGGMGGWVASQGNVVLGAYAFTFQGTPNWSVAGAQATLGGQIQALPGASIVGSATGKRYDVSYNGVILTNGGGANFLPGSVAGTSATGGQYA